MLRETPRGFESGWPWRWQVALEGAEDAPFAPARQDARWLYERCNALAGGRRLLLHLPLAPEGAAPSLFAGATLVKDMRPTEEQDA